MVSQAQTLTTASEYLQMPETNQPMQLLNREIIVSPAPVPKHQRILGHLCRLIDDLKPNGEVFMSPIDLYLDEHNIPQPDVVWIAENSACTVGEKRLMGAPELIVEVLSPGTEHHDRQGKFLLYERHGISEYWMADPDAEYIEVWQLEDGKFMRVGVFGPEDSFDSAMLGQKVELHSVFGK